MAIAIAANSAFSACPAIIPDSATSQCSFAVDRYGGYTGLKGSNTSGFFRAQKINGRYWLVTPDNNVLWSTGICVLQYRGTTR